METSRNPVPTVDIIIELEDGGIVLIRRKNPPPGWAIPGGFIDYGESAEEAAVREAWEETSLQVQLIELLHVYSDPKRDPRGHTISTVFIARASGTPRGADDAAEAGVFSNTICLYHLLSITPRFCRITLPTSGPAKGHGTALCNLFLPICN
jgi:ADP-ribose pyrophosphatase YjhB (NUDIX family)